MEEIKKAETKILEDTKLSETLLSELQKTALDASEATEEVIIPNSTEQVMRIPISTLFPQLAAQSPEKAKSQTAAKEAQKVADSATDLPETLPIIVTKDADEAHVVTSEALLKLYNQKKKNHEGDELITIHVNKQILLLILGLILSFIWIYPFIKQVPQQIVKQFVQTKPTTNLTTQSTTTPPLDTAQRIRVRMQHDSLEAANAIKSLLAEAGFTSIEVITDLEVNSNTMLIVTRADNDNVRQKLTELFKNTYRVASETAQLSEDSDFTASILVGKNSLLK